MQKNASRIVRWLFVFITVGLAARLLFPISDQIVQRVSADRRWDARISAWLESLMTSIDAITFPSWLLLALATSIGATLTAWLLPWLSYGLAIWDRRKQAPDPILLRHVRAFHASYFSEAANVGIQTLQILTQEVARSKDSNASQWAGLLQRSVIDKAQFARTSFEAALKQQASLNEIQDLLGKFVREYQAVRTYIAISSKAVHSKLPEGAFFDNWRQSDDRLLQELRRLCGLPEFERLSRHVISVGWGENVIRDIQARPRPQGVS